MRPGEGGLRQRMRSVAPEDNIEGYTCDAGQAAHEPFQAH